MILITTFISYDLKVGIYKVEETKGTSDENASTPEFLNIFVSASSRKSSQHVWYRDQRVHSNVPKSSKKKKIVPKSYLCAIW